MKTFLKWAEEKKLDLPVIVDETPEKVETDGRETPKAENTRRTGYSANYPDAYVKSQYPQKYFNPYKGSADLDKQNMDKKDIKTPPDSMA